MILYLLNPEFGNKESRSDFRFRTSPCTKLVNNPFIESSKSSTMSVTRTFILMHCKIIV